MHKYSGFFISFEGGEGSGKTCQLRHLVDALREDGLKVFPTREPGGASISEQIREILHSLKNTEMHPRTETLLYQAARAQFVEEVVFPHLDRGEIVITDRFFDSTLAYQGYGHQQDLGEILPLVHYATGGLTPDLTVFFDVDVETGLGRRNGTAEWNRMDAYALDFHRRVRQGYLELVGKEPKRWITVDANKSIDEVFLDLREKIEGRLASDGFLERPVFGPER